MTEAICPWLSSLPRYYKTTKVKEITEASASVGLLLATVVQFSMSNPAKRDQPPSGDTPG